MNVDSGYIYFDGVGKGKGGLCDRLKGMYSCYVLSSSIHKTFYYNIPHPVALKANNFQQPKEDANEELNIIDWENYLNYKSKIEALDFPLEKYKIHTNIDFVNDLKNNITFNQFMLAMFDLKSFENENEIFKYDIGVHIRCGGGMVDWNDYDFGIKFDNNKFKERLIEVCSNCNETYICSDSQKVLDLADSLNLKNLTISPFTPNHIDRGNDVLEKDYINTFYDLLTLANCKLIYNTQGEFAKTASRIYNNEIQHFFN